MASIEGAKLLACPTCDTLHHAVQPRSGERAHCVRCGLVILAPRDGLVAETLALSAAALILMLVALGFPFLKMSVAGLTNTVSVIDAVLAFAAEARGGVMALLSLVVLTLIIALPVLRLAALLYALGPLLWRGPPPTHAAPVLRLAMWVRPWAMTDIFMIGVAVALVKISEEGALTFGPAFWAFAALMLLVVLKDRLLCERSLWRLFDSARAR